MERISGKHSLIYRFLWIQQYGKTSEKLEKEEYIFYKHYNQDTVDLASEALPKIFQHRVFPFEESLSNCLRGIVGERYNQRINVLKRVDYCNLIIVKEIGCEKANNRLRNLYSFQFYCLFFFFLFYLHNRFI